MKLFQQSSPESLFSSLFSESMSTREHVVPTAKAVTHQLLVAMYPGIDIEATPQPALTPEIPRQAPVPRAAIEEAPQQDVPQPQTANEALAADSHNYQLPQEALTEAQRREAAAIRLLEDIYQDAQGQ